MILEIQLIVPRKDFQIYVIEFQQIVFNVDKWLEVHYANKI